ncbi:hypothetical protein MKK55_14465 [Methylobacterium sp. J-059]|uniref:hypothetical protein n=1 Tax=Methylobacterium sp. J-059 TaxID=2836643 RepID=UPI001FBA378B|nr:hypothetical protein [Methylobacterium sp. J-059]MCJ2040134.1 hypothetical protein [Methylobacterium sp. J-059]
MALTGIHVTCAQIGDVNGASLISVAFWSRTMTNPGVTDIAAPQGRTGMNFEVRAAVDAWVARGENPDPTQVSGIGDSARILIPANETRNILCIPGDKIAWATA